MHNLKVQEYRKEQNMSDLRPKGVPIELEGVERHLLFTLNAINELQEYYKEDLGKIIDRLTDKEESVRTLQQILVTLLNDEAEREAVINGKELKQYTDRQIGWLVTLDNQEQILLAVLSAYGVSLPEPDSENPNLISGQTNQ